MIIAGQVILIIILCVFMTLIGIHLVEAVAVKRGFIFHKGQVYDVKPKEFKAGDYETEIKILMPEPETVPYPLHGLDL